MVQLRVLVFVSATLLSSVVAGQDVYAQGVRARAAAGTTTTWNVYTCPNAGDCTVNVDVSIDPLKGCETTAVDFVDSNPGQTIVWVLGRVPAGYEVQFKDPGIVMTEGGQDVDDVTHDKKEHRKRVKRKSQTFLLYDILVEYRSNNAAGFTACPPKGPAIVNRG
jgi:hypothetical protein